MTASSKQNNVENKTQSRTAKRNENGTPNSTQGFDGHAKQQPKPSKTALRPPTDHQAQTQTVSKTGTKAEPKMPAKLQKSIQQTSKCRQQGTQGGPVKCTEVWSGTAEPWRGIAAILAKSAQLLGKKLTFVCVARLKRRKTSCGDSTWTSVYVAGLSLKAGGQCMTSWRWPTKLVMSWERIWDAKSCTCKVPFMSGANGQSPCPLFQPFLRSGYWTKNGRTRTHYLNVLQPFLRSGYWTKNGQDPYPLFDRIAAIPLVWLLNLGKLLFLLDKKLKSHDHD